MRKKAQTAMEYLMTYGWAILIIIVVVAALYALGVFSVRTSVACSPCFSYFAYRDYDDTTGTVYIRNGARTLSLLTSDVGTVSDDCSVAGCDPGVDLSLAGIDTSLGPVTITLSYTDADTQVIHTDTAKIS